MDSDTDSEQTTFRFRIRGVVHRRDGWWALPFPGSDASVVYRTQRRLREECGARPVQFRAYFSVSAWSLLPLFLAGVVLVLLALCAWGRRLLLRHPRLFSAGAVSRQQVAPQVMANTRFTLTLHGQGWPEGVATDQEPTKRLTAKVSGSNPGYGATVVALLHSALTILEEKDKLPRGGGVMTTGFAFRNTSLIKRLHENNLTFEIVDE